MRAGVRRISWLRLSCVGGKLRLVGIGDRTKARVVPIPLVRLHLGHLHFGSRIPILRKEV